MAGYAAIYRATQENDNEQSSGMDKIVFGENNSYTMNINYSLNKKDTNLTSPGSNDTDRPDLGVQGTTITLDIYFDEKLETATDIQKLITWSQEADDTPELFPKGRFGFRYDYRTELNCRPTHLGGYKILDFTLNQEGATPRFSIGKLTLLFDGLYSRRATQ